jgi:small subunit ribosomal protein S5
MNKFSNKKNQDSRQGGYKKREDDGIDQRLIDLARVTRVKAGGKRMRFRAAVAVGDKKGKIGWAVAKGADVTIAINKAVTLAKKRMIEVPVINGTIPHQTLVKYKAARVFLRPAKKGTGVIAGGAVRMVLELAGYADINAKILGSTNKINNTRATFEALSTFKKIK